MKPRYEKQTTKRKISKPLLIGLIASGVILLIATAIFCVLWFNAIFNEQTLTITLMLIAILGVIGIVILTWKLRK